VQCHILSSGAGQVRCI